MQDAAASILLERQALGRPSALPVLVSLALHGALAAAVLLAPRIDRRRDEPRPIAISMRLAPRRPTTALRATSAAPRRQARRAPAVIEPKAPPQPRAEPQTKKQGRVDPARTAAKSVFGKSPEPASAPRKSAAVAGGAPPAPAAGEGEFAAPGVGAAGVTGLEGDFPYAIYIDRMTTKIGSNWFRPQAGGDLITVVYFVIVRGGAIRDARVERSSGNRTFDRAAYRAVIESSPLPPLPLQYGGTHLGVHLTFR